MDGLNAQFGRLSTSAAEWRPSSSSSAATSSSVQQTPQYQQHQQHQLQQYPSDLSATKVKEFVPGQGWATANTETTQVVPEQHPQHLLHQQQHQQQQQHQHAMLNQHQQQANSELDKTVTFPSGPTPPPLPSFRAIHSLGVPDDTWNYYREISMESARQMEPTDERHKEVLPPYCNAYCLDNAEAQKSTRRSSLGYPCRTFQVTSREDGHLYCLHRFDDVRGVSPKIAAAVSERWTQAHAVQEHPGIVPLYRCFVAQRAVFFVHQYVPGARTLLERCVLLMGGPLSESVLWSCITQLVSAIRIVHQCNLAVRTIDLQHVLSNTDATNSRLRLRLNCVGCVDALEFESRKHVSDLQRQDIRDLGWLILSLATGTELSSARTAAANNNNNTTTTTNGDNTFARCENFLMQNFSRELHNLVMTLIKSSPHPPSIVDVSRAMAPQAFDEHDMAYRSLDLMDRLLCSEYESGRCLRLLLKLGFINERPEFGQDRRWSQSGDCYVLTLFRDFVFHQCNGSGYPVMDLGHVVTALNKLDAANEEQIVLTSRDGKSMMVVTYADVARCLENAFGELCSHNVPPASTIPFS